MPSLMELVDRVNKGEMIDSDALDIYQESSNSAEKFLAHNACAMLDLRRAYQHILQSLEAIEYSDQKVLNQFMSVSNFLGVSDMRAAPIIRFGASAITRREYGLGIEAIQNGVAFDLQHDGAYTSDRENCQFIAAQYERAAQYVCPVELTRSETSQRQIRLAIVVSNLCDDEASARMVRSLCRQHDSKRFKLCIYSTEAGVRREKQQFAQTSYTASSSKRGAQTMELLGKAKIQCWLAPTDGDAISSARELMAQMVKDRVQVAMFDANLSDPIAAMVSCWDCARVKINLCRRNAMYTRGMDCTIYLDQARYEADMDYWQRRGVESRYLLEGMDTDELAGVAPQRSAYGIPEQAVVLATAGADLSRTLSEEFVDTMIDILRAHPHAVYLLVGDGELTSQRRKFEASGVGKRIGYAGRRKDLPDFLRIADIYLAEFPVGSAGGVLQAMSVERPVVAARWGESAERCQAAVFAGPECTISSRDSGAYIERVSKLIREAPYRQQIGKSMRERIDQHFGFAQTARQLEQICEQLCGMQNGPSSVGEECDRSEPLADVA